MLNVVVDTNVLVRAYLKPDSTDGKIIKMVVDGQLNLFYSYSLISELNRVLRYKRLKKFGVTDEGIEIFLQTILTLGKIISPTKKITICRDPDDNELLSIAKSIYPKEPVYLLTSDNDLLILEGKIEDAIIFTPQEFLKKGV